MTIGADKLVRSSSSDQGLGYLISVSVNIFYVRSNGLILRMHIAQSADLNIGKEWINFEMEQPFLNNI